MLVPLGDLARAQRPRGADLAPPRAPGWRCGCSASASPGRRCCCWSPPRSTRARSPRRCWSASVRVALAALAARLLAGPAALALACGATVVAYAVDVVAGSPLTALSVLGPNPGGGVRFFGIGNELEAILTTLTLIGTGAWLWRPRPRTERRTAAIWFVGVARARRRRLRARPLRRRRRRRDRARGRRGDRGRARARPRAPTRDRARARRRCRWRWPRCSASTSCSAAPT